MGRACGYEEYHYFECSICKKRMFIEKDIEKHVKRHKCKHRGCTNNHVEINDYCSIHQGDKQ